VDKLEEKINIRLEATVIGCRYPLFCLDTSQTISRIKNKDWLDMNFIKIFQIQAE